MSDKFVSLADPTLAPIVADLPQTMSTISNYSTRLKELRTALLPTMSTTNITTPTNPDSDFYVANGISFLQLRTQILLQYNMNLLQYMTLRSDGRKLKDHPCIHRLVHFRLLLEKIKPITTQLQYQIDQILQQQAHKLTQTATATTTNNNITTQPTTTKTTTAATSTDDQFTAQIPLTKEQLNQQKKQEYRERQEQLKQLQEEQNNQLSKLNRDLKFNPLATTNDSINTANVGDDAASQWHAQEHRIAREKEHKEKIRDKALYSTLVKQLREELTERPMEESATGLSMHQFRTREQRERHEFEEENYMRLHDNKQERKKQRRLERLQGMDDIEDVADFRALYQFDSQQKQRAARDQALREYEAQQAQDQLMERIEKNVKGKYAKDNHNNNKRKKPHGGF